MATCHVLPKRQLDNIQEAQAMSTHEAAKPIVVGVDGSAHSYWAIERAIEEAARRQVGVRLVHALDQGFVVITLIPGEGVEQLRHTAEDVLRDAMAAAEGRGVPVEGHLGYGPPGPVLVEASRGASMLVVGSRGRSTCRGSSRASVTSTCVHHASCPVEVVPAPEGCRARLAAATL